MKNLSLNGVIEKAKTEGLDIMLIVMGFIGGIIGTNLLNKHVMKLKKDPITGDWTDAEGKPVGFKKFLSPVIITLAGIAGAILIEEKYANKIFKGVAGAGIYKITETAMAKSELLGLLDGFDGDMSLPMNFVPNQLQSAQRDRIEMNGLGEVEKKYQLVLPELTGADEELLNQVMKSVDGLEGNEISIDLEEERPITEFSIESRETFSGSEDDYYNGIEDEAVQGVGSQIE